MNIWVPRMKIIEPNWELALPTSMAGRFVMEAVRPDGRKRKLAEFDNLILDSGLDRIGNNADWLSACQVGTGANTPAASQTALQTFRAGTSTLQFAGNSTAQANAPYFIQNSRTFRFSAGAASGNISEVGVGWSASSGANLFSRALILDQNLDPTTITVLGDEFLDVTYILRVFVPPNDVTGQISVSGTTHDFTVRAAQANSTNYMTGPAFNAGNLITNGDVAAHSGGIGAITSIPGGSSSNGSHSAAAYTPGSLFRDRTGTWGLNNANFVGGIQSFRVDAAAGRFQVGVSPAIMKDNTKTLVMTFRSSWARRP